MQICFKIRKNALIEFQDDKIPSLSMLPIDIRQPILMLYMRLFINVK